MSYLFEEPMEPGKKMIFVSGRRRLAWRCAHSALIVRLAWQYARRALISLAIL